MPERSYDVLYLSQRQSTQAPNFCVFHAPAAEILEWADVKRLNDEVGAPQRDASPAKVHSIKRFLALDDRNTIPSAVIVTLDMDASSIVASSEDPNCKSSRLVVKVADDAEAEKPGVVIDGQHRLLGMAEYSPDIHVVVVALLNASRSETAFQFLVINNKATKVPTDHIRALLSELPKEEFEERLKTARLSMNSNYRFVAQVDGEEDSPFYRQINWPSNRDGEKWVLPAAIESSLSYIESRNVRAFLESDDNLLEFFMAVWRVVRTRWPDLWNGDSRLLSKVGVICLNEFLADSLIKLSDWGELDLRDPSAVAKRTSQLLSYQSKDFWSMPWTTSSLDTQAGRRLVVEALVQIQRNMREGEPWYEDIRLVDVTGLE